MNQLERLERLESLSPTAFPVPFGNGASDGVTLSSTNRFNLDAVQISMVCTCASPTIMEWKNLNT